MSYEIVEMQFLVKMKIEIEIATAISFWFCSLHSLDFQLVENTVQEA